MYNCQEMAQNHRRKRHNAPTPPRVTLTRQTVVEGALALADAEGLEAVTIRRLAKRLGVTPMALYWHFPSKDELLDGVAASLFEKVDLSLGGASGGWQNQLRALLGK